MGFLDKLKGVAKNAGEKLAEMQQEKEKQKEINALKGYGSIKGSNIPEKAEFCLDGNKNRLIIRTGTIDNYNLISEYRYDDVAELKFLKCGKPLELTGYTSIGYDLKILLNSGEEFDIYMSIREPKEEKELYLEWAARDRNQFIDLSLAFMLKINDSATKEWMNSFYEKFELLPVFDENGEFLGDNLEENLPKL